jgi:hypothetical protein
VESITFPKRQNSPAACDHQSSNNQGNIDMAFYELRQYKIRPGKMEAWLEFMQTVIIPFQVKQGMVISGSFRGEEDDSVYVWIRRFESEAQREQLYAAVYESDFWKNEVTPQVTELIDREAIQVQRIVATRMSILQ